MAGNMGRPTKLARRLKLLGGVFFFLALVYDFTYFLAAVVPDII